MTLSNPVKLAIFRRGLMGGGAERVLINLAHRVAESGIKVDLILSRAEGPLLKIVPPSVEIIDLKAANLDNQQFFKLPTSFSSLTSLPKLVAYLQKEKPAALLSASHYSNEIAILAKLFARVSTSVVVSEHIALSVQARRVEQISSRLAPLTSRLLYPFANGIVAVSKGVATDLAKTTKIPLQRIQTIYNPVITPELLKKSRETVDFSWFGSDNSPVILGTGRLVKQKDFPNLIRAFALVREKIPARLVILGSGREEKTLKNLIEELNLQDKVILPGFVTNPWAYMAKASVFVLSSAWEVLPTVLIEAVAVGTPIVSTDCESGPKEILDRGKYGDLVPVGDYRSMAEAILKVLSGTTKTVDRAWLKQFTLETATKKYSDLLGIKLS